MTKDAYREADLRGFWLAFNQYWADHPQQRAGQALFNTLSHHKPALAKKLQGTRKDPFYTDDRFEAAKLFIEENW